MDDKSKAEQRETLRLRPWRAEGLEAPEFETILDWGDEGGSEAACPEGCWVEPDGWCEHGRPSWLLVLGMV